MEILSSKLLWEILKHAKSWLTNLDRASNDRKTQSVKAVRKVITASRETAVYIRSIKDTGQPNHETEARLSVLWTELGFELQDIGIHKLAKRCQIRGKHWADPDHYDQDFLQKADISLETMEKLANEILIQISR
ncbi:hypothetical protein [Methylotenera sp. 1P/1]|uniref:hypothetical protein n=1 Tax=Methylotenera sp. 1P/1 TaxID=1131551 RepID=UPI000382E224|nr:hypothetical protein [Methylotenera sp. 1P/1]